jgi:hypothetical protein
MACAISVLAEAGELRYTLRAEATAYAPGGCSHVAAARSGFSVAGFACYRGNSAAAADQSLSRSPMQWCTGGQGTGDVTWNGRMN